MKKCFCQKSQLALALVAVLTFSATSTSVFAASASSAQQAAQIAMQQSGSGKVLGVSTETDDSGRQVFAVKILSNGRVRVIRIPRN